MGALPIIFAVAVLVIFIAIPLLMDSILTTYPVGTGYKAFNAWKQFMNNIGWFYYLLSGLVAAVAYGVGLKMEGGGIGMV